MKSAVIHFSKERILHSAATWIQRKSYGTGGPLITRSSCNADFPLTRCLFLVRGGVRTIYLISSSNTAYFEQAQKSTLQEDPLYYN